MDRSSTGTSPTGYALMPTLLQLVVKTEGARQAARTDGTDANMTTTKKVEKPMQAEAAGPAEQADELKKDEKPEAPKPEAKVERKDGDVETAFKNAAKVIRSEYQCPFLPHSPMEPMNFFAHVREDGVELVGPTQRPDGARTETAKLLGIDFGRVEVRLSGELVLAASSTGPFQSMIEDARRTSRHQTGASIREWQSLIWLLSGSGAEGEKGSAPVVLSEILGVEEVRSVIAKL